MQIAKAIALGVLRASNVLEQKVGMPNLNPQRKTGHLQSDMQLLKTDKPNTWSRALKTRLMNPKLQVEFSECLFTANLLYEHS